MESLAILLTQLFIPLALLVWYGVHSPGSAAELGLWALGLVLLLLVTARYSAVTDQWRTAGADDRWPLSAAQHAAERALLVYQSSMAH